MAGTTLAELADENKEMQQHRNVYELTMCFQSHLTCHVIGTGKKGLVVVDD
ncbi:hypothetical protein AX14_008788 [Amanita brunnescens Koide BX004]|nr:hypothetical protein AX14_008788 [Amanita brunnescens Koide BX004]